MENEAGRIYFFVSILKLLRRENRPVSSINCSVEAGSRDRMLETTYQNHSFQHTTCISTYINIYILYIRELVPANRKVYILLDYTCQNKVSSIDVIFLKNKELEGIDKKKLSSRPKMVSFSEK